LRPDPLIEIDHVTFGYDSSRTILNDVNLRFVRGQPVVLGAMLLDMVAVILGGAVALLPIYAKDILQVGPWGLGLLRAAPAVGALAMSLWLTRRPLRHRVGRRLLQAVAVMPPQFLL
jgi:DNA-binding transcriptional LysR family regulator